MKIAVIHDAPIPPQTAKDLLVELLRRGVTTSYVRISRLNSEIVNGTSKILYGRENVLELDGAILRGIGNVTSMETLLKRLNTLVQLELNNVLLINSTQGLMNARDKFRAIQLLTKAGVRVPESLLTEDVYALSEVVRNWGKAVIKPIIGSMGYGSLLVTDPDIAYIVGKTWLEHGQPILAQKYVRNYDRDIRVFVVGDEVLGAIYRYRPQHTWKTNVSQGGKVEKAHVDSELEELSLKATKALNLDYAGVDVGESDDGYVVYEVNAMPNWQGFLAGTGLNPAPKIVDYLINKIKK